MESDWRKFSAMVPDLRERYLARVNARVIGLLTDPDKDHTEQFWDAMEVMKKEARTLVRCLDGHSRSKMWYFMVDMIACGMLREEDLADFSDPLREEMTAIIKRQKQ